MDFIEKCKKIAFRVQCLECSLEIETTMMLRQHMAETNKQHPVSSLADCNLVGVLTLESTNRENFEFANSVNSDEVAHIEPPHLDLHCLRSRRQKRHSISRTNFWQTAG